MQSFAKIIQKFTQADFSEMPKAIVEQVKMHFWANLFDKIGYDNRSIPNFGKIVEFAARYEIALWNTNMQFAPQLQAIYENDVKGKKFRLPKGLLLFGSYGTGKTMAARILADRFEIPFIDTYTIALNYLKKDGDDWLENFLLGNSRTALVIDDVGAEGEIRRFGNNSPMGAILSTRARFWEMYGTPTIYTSNLGSPTDIAAKYGNDDRLADRLNHYYVPVEFKGISLRK
jgi:DNA replication protein DnaC